jgi:hypothetical protein
MVFWQWVAECSEFKAPYAPPVDATKKLQRLLVLAYKNYRLTFRNPKL